MSKKSNSKKASNKSSDILFVNAVVVGCIVGLLFMIITLFSIRYDIGKDYLNNIAMFLPYYSVTTKGAFIGLLLGFFEAFLFVYLFDYIKSLFKK